MSFLSRIFGRSNLAEAIDISAVEANSDDHYNGVTPGPAGVCLPASEVAWRAIILQRLVSLALSTTDSNISESLIDSAVDQLFASEGIRSRLTSTEKALITLRPNKWSAQQRAETLWKLEAACTLLWTLGQVESLPDSTVQCDAGVLVTLVERRPEEIAQKASLRDRREIVEAYNRAEFWYWRSCVYEQELEGDRPDGAAGSAVYNDLVRTRTLLAERRGDVDQALKGDVACAGKPFRELQEQEWLRILAITEQRFQALRWVCGAVPGDDWDLYPSPTIV